MSEPRPRTAAPLSGRLKARLAIAAVVGLAVVTALLAWVGLPVVGAAIRALGWSGFGLFCLAWVPVIAMLGLAWFSAAPGLPLRRAWTTIWGRLLREAAGEVLPFSQVGGLLVGSRAVIAAGVPEDLALASTIVDVTAEMAAQAFYTILGLALAVARFTGGGSIPLLWPALGGLALLFALVAAVMGGQRRAVGWAGKALIRWLPDSQARAEAAIATLDGIYRRRARIVAAVVLHVGGWIGSSTTAWIALRLMDVRVDLSTVIAMEAIMYAVRGLGFALPGGLGVQEGAYVLLAPFFGVPPADALALSLLRRARDIAFGVPVLAIWQAQEGRRLIGGPRRP